MGVNYPIKPGQIDGRCRPFALSFGGRFFVAKAAGVAWHARLVATKQSGGAFRRERKIETIRLSGFFSFARRSLHQQVRDLHEVVGKHSRRDPHLKSFAAFGKAALSCRRPRKQHRDAPLDAGAKALARP